MPRILSYAAIAITMVFTIILNQAWAKSPTPLKVMTSIKPIQIITQELTKDVADTEVLLANNTSPHDYALKPSDIRKLKEADIFIWVGPGLESFLEGTLKDSQNSLQLDQYDSIDKLAYDEHEGHEHHDDGHHHGNYDPHLWLGPTQAQQMAEVIVDRLTQIDPKHEAQYAENYVSFIEQLNMTSAKIKQQLAPVKEHGYYVFHDAYQYYEQYFGLKHLGAFTISPDRRPGAKSLIAIRTALQSEEVYCVFSEPQFTPAVINSTTRGTKVSHGVLDPLATDVTVQPGAYFQFLQQLADNFTQCLSSKG